MPNRWLVVVGIVVGAAIVAALGGMGFWVMTPAAVAMWALLGSFIVWAGQESLYMKHLWEILATAEVVVVAWTAGHMSTWKSVDVKAVVALIIALLAIVLWRWLNREHRPRRRYWS